MRNPNTCTCENTTYLESIIGDSLTICDEIVEVTETVPVNTIPKNFTEKR